MGKARLLLCPQWTSEQKLDAFSPISMMLHGQNAACKAAMARVILKQMAAAASCHATRTSNLQEKWIVPAFGRADACRLQDKAQCPHYSLVSSAVTHLIQVVAVEYGLYCSQALEALCCMPRSKPPAYRPCSDAKHFYHNKFVPFPKLTLATMTSLTDVLQEQHGLRRGFA